MKTPVRGGSAVDLAGPREMAGGARLVHQPHKKGPRGGASACFSWPLAPRGSKESISVRRGVRNQGLREPGSRKELGTHRPAGRCRSSRELSRPELKLCGPTFFYPALCHTIPGQVWRRQRVQLRLEVGGVVNKVRVCTKQ